MAYIGKPIEYSNQPNFLKSAHFQAFTFTVPESLGIVEGTKKVVKAGTIFPANDATAKGVVYQDVDVTYGDQPASVIVEGYILPDRLPVKPEEAAVTALKEIKFVEGDK